MGVFALIQRAGPQRKQGDSAEKSNNKPNGQDDDFSFCLHSFICHLKLNSQVRLCGWFARRAMHESTIKKQGNSSGTIKVRMKNTGFSRTGFA